jgi:hypothetical protein
MESEKRQLDQFPAGILSFKVSFGIHLPELRKKKTKKLVRRLANTSLLVMSLNKVFSSSFQMEI